MRRRPGFELFLISWLVLFLELACIRWFPAHVLFLTFFTNTVLLASFVGMSVGCLLAARPGRLLAWTPLWLTLAVAAGAVVEQSTSDLYRVVDVAGQTNPEVVFFGAELGLQEPKFVIPVELVLGVFFVLVAVVLVGPGQELGRAFTRVPGRTRGYALNLLGSLAGIAAFAALSYLQTPPVVWFALAAAGVGYFLALPDPAAGGRSLNLMRGAFLAAAVLMTVGTSGLVEHAWGTTRWSPYYRVDYFPAERNVVTNLIGHQAIHPREDASAVEPYALPYLLRRDAGAAAGWGPFRRILIIGAGTGNDLSRACQWAPPDARIDAVEIDPAIQKLGAENNPDRPYQDPRVTVHLNDGRNFLRRAPDGEYDLVVFALIDSLVLHSGYSSLRLESYLYTAESMRDVRRVLKPTGVAAVYNFFRQGWIATRLRDIIRSAFGADPVFFPDPPRDRVVAAEADARMFSLLFAGSADVVDPLRKAFDGRRYWLPTGKLGTDSPAKFVDAGTTGLPPGVLLQAAAVDESPADLRPATDDWPFLYARRAAIPGYTWRGGAVVLLLALSLWAAFDRLTRGPGGATPPPAGDPAAERGLAARSFFLGAGFMLVETKAVVHMALLFGSTWMVNTVVFAAVLLMSLAGTLFAAWVKPRNLTPYYAGLVAALAVNIALPLDAFLGLDFVVQAVGSCLLVFAPVAFAGVVFATSFRRTVAPDRMIGANVAGALVGGLAENASMLLGFRYLLFLAAGFYLLSGAFGGRSSPTSEAEARV